MSLALLNNYQASERIKKNQNLAALSKDRTSRGQLIIRLLKFIKESSVQTENEITDIFEYLSSHALQQFEPFNLCAFSSLLSSKTAQLVDGVLSSTSGNQTLAYIFQWDGGTLTAEPMSYLVTSSGKNLTRVTNRREELFKHLQLETQTSAQHRLYHLQKTSPCSDSVNMNRDDAQSVSFSHIKVDKEIHFNYFDLIDKNWQQVVIAKNKLI